MSVQQEETRDQILDRMEAFAKAELETRRSSYLPLPLPKDDCGEAADLVAAEQHLEDIQALRRLALLNDARDKAIADGDDIDPSDYHCQRCGVVEALCACDAAGLS